MRTFTKATVAVVIAIAGIMATAAPASASWSSCSISYSCLWRDTGFSGSPFFEQKFLDSYNTGFWNNDAASSVANRSSQNSFMVYDNTDTGSGDGVGCVPRNYSQRNLHNESPRSWGDRISSVKIVSGACPDGVDYIGYYKTS